MFREFDIKVNREIERFNGATYRINFHASERFFHINNEDSDGIDLTEFDESYEVIKNYLFSKESVPNSQYLTLYVNGYKQIKKLKAMEDYIMARAEAKKSEVQELNKYIELYK